MKSSPIKILFDLLLFFLVYFSIRAHKKQMLLVFLINTSFLRYEFRAYQAPGKKKKHNLSVNSGPTG